MEGSGAGIGRLDCYEDMFKEITRKLYGEDPDHRTSSVQNEFETSYKNDEDTGNGTDGGASSDDGKWHLDDEPLEGTDGSRIAAYRAATSTWRCYECGDCMGGGPRDVAEHFVDLHSDRLTAEEPTQREEGRDKDYDEAPGDMKVEEVVNYLERVRDKAERGAPPPRRTQETQTIPATLLPVASSFMLQELPPTLPQHLHPVQQNSSSSSMPATTAASVPVAAAAATGTTSRGGGSGNGHASGKRYTCVYCPYGTDRRDLYTRHENIHREDKPFHCYVCFKPFSRADHVKKHFSRMHRDQEYELQRIRKTVSSAPKQQQQQQQQQPQQPSPATAPVTETNSNNSSSTTNSSGGGIPSAATYAAIYATPKPAQLVPHTPIATTYQLQTPATAALYQVATISSAFAAAAANMQQQQHNHQQQQQQQQQDVNCNRRVQNGASGKGGLKGGSSSGTSGKNQERRFACCYCAWSGVDNWCLKRHLNTHLKPYNCSLCEYKAARSERLATHVLKVHNRRQCSKCNFLAEDLPQLQLHQLHVHHITNPSVAAAAAAAAAAQSAAQSQNERQQPQQPQPIHPLGGGRAPAGPPVFPALASATSLIPPTTILGAWSNELAAAMALATFWQQSVWGNSLQNADNSKRSRKQKTPRKAEPCDEMDQPQDLSMKSRTYDYEQPTIPTESPMEPTMEISTESSMKSSTESQIASSEGSPIESRLESPIESRLESPIESRLESPIESRIESPIESRLESPIESRLESPIESRIESPIESRLESPVASPRESPVEIPMEESPVELPSESLIESPVASPRESPMEIPMAESPVESPSECSSESSEKSLDVKIKPKPSLKLRCLRWPRGSATRKFSYNTKHSLLLSNMWQHSVLPKRLHRRGVSGGRRLTKRAQPKRRTTPIMLTAAV